MAKRKILVVDDEPKIVSQIMQLLESDGYETVGAHNGNEGLEKAREHKPDLIILDILMPRMDGSAMAAALKEDPQTENIPIIYVSCLAEGMKQGNVLPGEKRNIFFGKPFDSQELLKMVKASLKT